MSNKQNWGYDDTKKMLNKLRTLNESKSKSSSILKEEVEQTEPTADAGVDYTVINDVEVKIHSSDKNDMIISDEEKQAISQLIDNFRQQVAELAEFEEGFNITTDEVRLDGTISDKDISFVYVIGSESGVYVNSNMTKLDPETIQVMDKLEKFYHTFSDSANDFILNRKNN
jgi:hypothetical protein